MTRPVSDAQALRDLITEGWVSLRKAAPLLGVSYPTVCAMRDRGELQVLKVGGIYRVSAKEITRVLGGHLPTTTPTTPTTPTEEEGESSPPL